MDELENNDVYYSKAIVYCVCVCFIYVNMVVNWTKTFPKDDSIEY